MEEKQIEEKIKIFIAEHFIKGNRGLKTDELLFESGIIDSMGFIILLGFLEKTFAVYFPMSEITMENFNTVRKIADAVHKKSKGRQR